MRVERVFRTAISERRILREHDGQITFAYKPSGSTTSTTCTLPVVDFLRRILLHVLPKGLHKIGYYGWMHPRAKARLERIRGLLQAPLLLADPPEAPPPTPALSEPASRMGARTAVTPASCTSARSNAPGDLGSLSRASTPHEFRPHPQRHPRSSLATAPPLPPRSLVGA